MRAECQISMTTISFDVLCDLPQRSFSDYCFRRRPSYEIASAFDAEISPFWCSMLAHSADISFPDYQFVNISLAILPLLHKILANKIGHPPAGLLSLLYSLNK